MTPMLAVTCTHWGPGPFFGLFWLLLWGALAFLFLTRGRRRAWWHGRYRGEAALAERYARGEIDADEYRARLTVLRQQGR
jgi:putative membrane protein